MLLGADPSLKKEYSFSLAEIDQLTVFGRDNDSPFHHHMDRSAGLKVAIGLPSSDTTVTEKTKTHMHS